MFSLNSLPHLLTHFDPVAGTIEGGATVERRLSDLRGIFADGEAYERALAEDNPVVYRVAVIEPAQGDGALHYGIGSIMPGRVGDEYYMTKGHLHAWRPASEFYIGLRGKGLMLLEDEESGETRLLPLEPNDAVYVPGYTAHRTINTGNEPLTYLGIYPANAGHDYSTIAERNFRTVVAEIDGEVRSMLRDEYLRRIGNMR
jgi:glucose-6-phosphate isomerase